MSGPPGAGRPGAPRPRSPSRQAGSGPVVVLVGPPGSGKSSVGRTLARLTGHRFRDTDLDIEQVASRTIPDIFLTDGEPAFRAMERAAVLTALAEHDGVLALGGGAIMADETRAALAGHPVVYLALTMPTGVKRTGLGAHRPLLVGVNPRATYRALLEARLPMYHEVAAVVVQTDELTVSQVAAVIIDRLGLG